MSTNSEIANAGTSMFKSILPLVGQFRNPPNWDAQVLAAVRQGTFAARFTSPPSPMEKLHAELSRSGRTRRHWPQ